MDENNNNNFLSGYNKRDDETPSEKVNLPEPVAPREVSVKNVTVSNAADKNTGFKYEQKSGFKPPERKENQTPPANGGIK